MTWIEGPLPGPNGPVPVVHHPRTDQSQVKVVMTPPNLCLHTTEGGTSLGDAYKRWQYPPNFAVGDGKIVQLFPLGVASKAVDTKDLYLCQVEISYSVGDRPATQVYLPPPSSLDPLVALVAYLHKNGHIRTGLKRPNSAWPVQLDRLPAAVDTYYRRNDGTWPKPGVYGHVEIPDDEHYDPASFDYPRFFQMVEAVLATEEESDVSAQEWIEGFEAFVDGDPEPAAGWKRRGWRQAKRFAAQTVAQVITSPGDHTHEDLAPVDHEHAGKVTVR